MDKEIFNIGLMLTRLTLNQYKEKNMNKENKELIFKIVNDALANGIKEMDYPSLSFIWWIFVTHKIDSLYHVETFFEIIERIMTTLPKDMSEEIVCNAIKKIEESLRDKVDKDLNECGVDTKELDEIIKKAKDKKKEESPEVKVKEKTMTYKVDNEKELEKVLKSILDDMKESMKNAD